MLLVFSSSTGFLSLSSTDRKKLSYATKIIVHQAKYVFRVKFLSIYGWIITTFICERSLQLDVTLFPNGSCFSADNFRTEKSKSFFWLTSNFLVYFFFLFDFLFCFGVRAKIRRQWPYKLPIFRHIYDIATCLPCINQEGMEAYKNIGLDTAFIICMENASMTPLMKIDNDFGGKTNEIFLEQL